MPFAEELFGLEEAELLGRGKKDAEQKRELALQKCVVGAGLLREEPPPHSVS